MTECVKVWSNTLQISGWYLQCVEHSKLHLICGKKLARNYRHGGFIKALSEFTC